jgi:hypothetical protein
LDHLGGLGHTSEETEMDSIVEAFLGIDVLRDPAGLKMCIELSEQEIGEEIPTAQKGLTGSDEHSALKGLIGRLRWRDAAMWVFVETIQDLYGPGEIMESIRAAVRSLFAEPVLTREQRRVAHRLCSGLASADVAALFGLSVGGLGHTLESDVGNLHAVLNELENLPVRSDDGLHPVVAFVEFLASEQSPEVAEPLRIWVDSCVGERTPLVQALHAIRHRVPARSTPEPKYCVVQLDVDGIDADRFLVSIMFQEGAAPLDPLRPPDDHSYTEAEVRAFIGTALNQPKLAAAADLTIEFVLPGPLINQPVDQWHVGLGDIVLGVQYPIVVRSLDRIRHARNARTAWQAKWTRISAAEFHNEETAVGWLSSEAPEDGDRLFVQLTDEAAPVCLLLQVTPVPGQCGALLAALRAGIPAVLWSRRPTADIRAEFSSLLAPSAPARLRDLPLRVFEFRRQAVSNGADRQHLARHLTLLWDDADRIPDADSPLNMPV